MQSTQEQSKATKPSSAKSAQLIEIDREFNVPVSQLFGAFTTAEAIKVWWWPKGLHADRVDMNFREGGTYFFDMKGYDQGGGGMIGQFKEIIENKRILMTDHFADEYGKPISAKEAKMPGDWPEIIYITLDFESTGDSSSRLHLLQDGIPAEMQKDCVQGWTESFDKLENYLNGSR